MIYKQSIKGTQILETNATRLPQKIRNLLVLVDGESSVDEIQVLFGEDNISILLKSLFSLGLIEQVDDRQPSSAGVSFTPKAAVKSNDSLDKFRYFNSTSSSQQDLNAKFPPVMTAGSTSDDGFKAIYGASVTSLVDLLRDSGDLAAFELMFSLEKCNSINQLKLLLPHVVKLANSTPQNKEKIKKVLELVN